MAKRYKKFELDKIKGTGLEIWDKHQPYFINTSAGIKIDPATKRLQEAESYDSGVLEDVQVTPRPAKVMAAYEHTSLAERLMLLVEDATDGRVECKYLSTGTPLIQVKSNLAASSVNPSLLLRYKTYYLAFYFSTGTNNKVAISADDGATWTPYDFLYPLPIDFLIIEDVLYLWNTNEIIYTTDGANYTTFYAADTQDLTIYGFCELDGEKYALLGIAKQIAKLVKFNHANQPEEIEQVQLQGAAALFKFNNKICLIKKRENTYIDLLILDASGLKIKSTIKQSSVAEITVPYVDSDNAFIVNQSIIYRLDKNWQFYQFFTCVDSFVALNKLNNQIIVMESDGSANEEVTVRYFGQSPDVAVTNTSVFTTPCINERHVPAHLVIKHDPLPDDATIVVKAKSNRASTFATTLLTNTTNGSVRSVVALSGLLNEVDAIEFEITITNKSDATKVKNIHFIYLYILTGIEKN